MFPSLLEIFIFLYENIECFLVSFCFKMLFLSLGITVEFHISVFIVLNISTVRYAKEYTNIVHHSQFISLRPSILIG